MISPWKPRLEALEARDTPAVFHLITPALQVVYPPADPTLPPEPPPSDTTPVVVIPTPPPWVPGS